MPMRPGRLFQLECPAAANAAYQVDGLAGATLTTRGVSNLVQYWLGDNGFAPFLANLKAGEA
jgi:Na+-transporting NADH:ubiquinone oxidoreductase subunit C